MKTKRFVSTLLALLLVCGLPVSAFAADNYEDMFENNGTVDTNYNNIELNNGVVEINEGNVETNSSTGTVTTNNGTVTSNNSYGTVDTNSSTGTVTTNNGTVDTNHGTVTTNYGTVDDNFNIVETNNGVIYANEAEVKINNGTVDINVHAVETNNGTVNINDGTVRINNTTGIVNNGDGVVFTNYGTVNTLEYDRNVGKWFIDETWYGVQVDNDGTPTLEQKEAGKVLDFSQLTKEGYVYAGYTQEYQMGENGVEKLASPITVNSTSYTVTCPNVLTLIWQAIFSPAADDGAGYFGPGSHIAINGHKFLLVAVVEDVYCLASVDSFEEEQLSDLPALLASLLTEEQLTHVTGEPELLDEELTARFFGGEGSHIVFPCDRSLIFS